MKTKIYTVIFLLSLFMSSFSVFAQINKYDTKGKRHGVWKKYFKNDRIRYSGSFEHGKEVGTFKFYSAANSEFPTVIKMYAKNSDAANVTFYTVAGLIESKGQMTGKDRIGKWTYFHENGKTVMVEETYKNGKLNGPYKTFFKTGKPTEITSYIDGLLDGNYKKYAIKGHIYQDFNYKSGKLNGLAIYYNRKTGLLTTKGEFKNDLRVGIWENYVDGELVSTEQPNKRKPPRKKTKTE